MKKKGAVSYANEKVILLIEAKIQPARRANYWRPPARTCRSCGGTGRRSLLPERARGQSQYVRLLRNLQVKSRAGFSSAAGVHQEFLATLKSAQVGDRGEVQSARGSEDAQTANPLKRKVA